MFNKVALISLLFGALSVSALAVPIEARAPVPEPERELPPLFSAHHNLIFVPSIAWPIADPDFAPWTKRTPGKEPQIPRKPLPYNAVVVGNAAKKPAVFPVPERPPARSATIVDPGTKVGGVGALGRAKTA